MTKREYNHYITTKEGKPNGVVAVRKYRGKTIRGVAKCDPRDDFDFAKGKELAEARCEHKIALRRAKDADDAMNEAVRATAEAKAHETKMRKRAIMANDDLIVARDYLYSVTRRM